MTEEQIKQNAEKCADGFIADAIFKRYLRDTYIAGAHSRNDEIKDLSIAATGLAKENKELKIKLAELRNPWISVVERLPEEGECVIFMDNNGSLYLGHHFLPSDMGRTWFADGGFAMKDDEVTHWMPIPELK